MAVNNIVKRIQNIMRKDPGVNGDAQRIEQMAWMFFLKVYDTMEADWEYLAQQRGDAPYTSIIPERLRWRNWAIDHMDGNAPTGDELLQLVDGDLFPTLKQLTVMRETPRRQAVVHEVFEDLNQYMKNGILLRQVINVVNEMEFDDPDDRHTFGDIYEGILKDLQSAGNAGEFYTPRALTDLMVLMLKPQLNEQFADFTSGTGGFLTSAIRYMTPMVHTVEQRHQLQNAVSGQEWKPFPYLLSITNLMLKDIESPNILHCDSLGTNVRDFTDDDRVDVIAMNPPYGGSTDPTVMTNFPTDMRSSETADLFLVLIMYRLRRGGRAAVIIPDGFLFGTDGAKYNIKCKLLRDFDLHTVIRLPGSIFSPYTSIATNILFFDNRRAADAPEGYSTARTWFYRLDMPQGYKHFSKTRPMRLEHCQPIIDWWDNRHEMVSDDGTDVKSRCFTVEQLMELNCNLDQCKFPKDAEEVLPPAELLADYFKRRAELDHEIDDKLARLQQAMGIEVNPQQDTYNNK